MAGAHDLVGDVMVLVAQMALEAQFRALNRPVGRIQPLVLHQVGMADLAGDMVAQPALAAAMAGLAADAV